MKNVKIGLLVLGAALVLVGAGCSRTKEIAPEGTSPDEAASEGAQTSDEGVITEGENETASEVPVSGVTGVTETTVEGEASASAPEVQSFSITARKWEFEPSSITVKKGNTVKLSITSADVSHGFGLPEFGISKTIEAGETAEVEFVADKVGEFAFSCTVYCGEGHGDMKGTLVVTE